MTRNKILIIGRKSFAEEDPSGSHVAHARACIVLSKNMDADSLVQLAEKRRGPELRLARSFDEALSIAQDFNTNDELYQNNGIIDCWVAGGAAIYKEALNHPNLQEVNLTHVDMKIDENLDQFQTSNHVTFFPIETFHRIGFEEVSRSVDGSCTFCVYKRRT